MKKITLLVLLSQLFVKLLAYTPLPPERPSIIVNIITDNISIQDLENNNHLFVSDGIRRITNEGTKFTNAYYPYALNSLESDYATIATGATPRHHGIVGKHWYNSTTEKYESTTISKKSILIGTKEKQDAFDASKLLCSTLGDELKLSTFGIGKSFSVSLEPNAAVILGGHAADGVFWLDEKTGKFISSDYYVAWLPKWVDDFNDKKFADFYLTQDWELLHKQAEYNSNNNNTELPITINEYQDESKPYSVLKQTPMGNMLVADFAKELIESEHLGKDEVPDILNINIQDVTESTLKIKDNSLEKADYILRLDREIERLIKTLDKEVGSHRYIITLVSTQNKGVSIHELEKYKIPSGIFNPDRATALLNSYLMALHGQGEWVLNFSNQQFFLNHELIKKSNLEINAFQDEVAEFMEEFSGVKWAIPSYKLRHADYNNIEFLPLQESYYPNRSGDIMISYSPGWAEESKVESRSTHIKTASLMVYGWKTERHIVKSRINITGFAPTLSNILNINMPNNSLSTTVFEHLLIK